MSHPHTDTIRVLIFNVRKRDELQENLPDFTDHIRAIAAHDPDVVLLQELDGTTGKPLAPNGRPAPGAAVDTRQAERLAHSLGMRIRIADAPVSTVHTAIAWRPDLELLHWEELSDRPFHHGQSLALLQGPGWADPITFASVHFDPFSTCHAAEEGRHLIEPLLKHSPLALAGGDFNTPTRTDVQRGVDWASLPPHNRSARLVADGGPPRPNLELDHVLALADLADPAERLHAQSGDPELIAATGKGGLRVDRFHLTQPLLEHVVDCRPVPGHEASDHVPVLLTLTATV
ncbi:endonuclease/exonuclease/phosphatase family protein [Nocardiopsis metallicus]|uniref:Endonuclease/exonuclease/phosphatase family metal-dependent hydrolase n=1 Tax=Nocardiopsis metallicus TaxID=179819 RepID=A0A840WH11_9ACTN|nr:endonuclease/exonuclease/phosphatase family protein [Nocardiopsis metallicus]MBB5494753.1 endonuclease/exonuclease/phosphatase family metal-dependent hydrolase [Nocardiopsis metallicus]